MNCDFHIASDAINDAVTRTMAATSASGFAADDVATQARLPGWILTNATSWENVLVQLRERLPLQLQTEPFSLPMNVPESWDWLCTDRGPLLICWGTFQVGQPRGYTEYRCRQISAICACLDALDHDEEPAIDDFGSDFSSVACRAISVPLDVPWALGKAPFEHGGLNLAGRAHVLMPHWPLDDADHIQRLEAKGLPEILRWVDTEGNNGRLKRALDAFESARSLGGRYGSIPAAIEEGWRLTALCTCLEELFCPPSRTVERRRLERTNFAAHMALNPLRWS